MSLESTLERIAVAIEAVAKQAGAEIITKGPGRPPKTTATPDLTQTATQVTAPSQPAAAPVEAAASGPTREQVQKAVTEGITNGHRDAVVATLKEHGATNVSTLKAADYPVVHAKLTALALAG